MRYLILLTLCLNLQVGVASSSKALLEDERNTIDIFKQYSPLVVFVYKIRQVRSPFNTYYVPSEAGSGFFWDKQGHIVTNYHVVNGARSIAISFEQGKAYQAKIIGIEPRKDIAVLSLVSKKPIPYLSSLPKLDLADINQLEVGQKMIAIGNPFGLNRTMTTGVISALGRRVVGPEDIVIHDMIQTDASVNPGNSGGPLFSSRGELLGMNTAIYSRTGSYSGIGFAVPADAVERIVSQVLQFGRVVQKGFGIQPVDRRFAEQLGIDGVIIGEVMKGSPADKAGLKGTYRQADGQLVLGDVVVYVGTTRVRQYADYYNVLEKATLGETLEVRYVRNRQLKSVSLPVVDITAAVMNRQFQQLP